MKNYIERECTVCNGLYEALSKNCKYCPECKIKVRRKQYMDSYYKHREKHLDHVKEYNKQYYIGHREKVKSQVKEYIEDMIIEDYTKAKNIKEWRDRNTFEKDGKKYIPICGLNKIYDETPKAYLIWFEQWIPKSISYKDDKYLYCEEWMYKNLAF